MAEKKFTNELKQAFDYIQNTILKEYETDKISTEYFILSIFYRKYAVYVYSEPTIFYLLCYKSY